MGPWATRHDVGATAVLRLNRPERLNAFTGEDMAGLVALLDEIAEDASVRCVVLTGEGRGFCAGGDLGAMSTAEPTDRDDPQPGDTLGIMRPLVRAAELLHELPVLSIAAINGPAAGAGLSLALACDLRLCVPGAVVTTAFAKVGQSGDYGMAWFLERIAGQAGARRLLLLSEKLDGTEALRLGLVDELVEPEDLLERAEALGEAAAELGGSTLGAIKANLANAGTLGLAEYLDAECEVFAENQKAPGTAERVRAFVERAAPDA